MPQGRLITPTYSATHLLPREILDFLHVDTVGEVEVSVIARTLTLRPLDELRRARKLSAVIEDVFESRKSAYEELAKGVE